MNDENKKASSYPPETAGRTLTTHVPTVGPEASLEAVEKLLQERSSEYDTINYVYVVRKSGILEGVFSIKELYERPMSTRVSEIMITQPAVARPHTDQENVVLIALKNNIKAVPVVDKNGVFLGVVSSDQILSILHDESVEDALRFAGTSRFEDPATLLRSSAWLHFKKRIPWLVFGLAGGILAASVVRFFENALEAEIMLAAFIPAVVYMADAVGGQSQIIFIRSLALTHRLDIRTYVAREIVITLMLALSLGLLAFFAASLWLNSFLLGAVFGGAIIVTIFAAMAVAIGLPLILGKFHSDPAIGSGPFATVIRDVLSLLIYFSIASLVL